MTVSIALRRLGSSPAGRPVLVLGPSLGTSADTLCSEAGAALAEEFDVLVWDVLTRPETNQPAARASQPR